jgi:hypothetical protein
MRCELICHRYGLEISVDFILPASSPTLSCVITFQSDLVDILDSSVTELPSETKPFSSSFNNHFITHCEE